MGWSPHCLIFHNGDLAGLECSILAYYSHIPFPLILGNQWLGRMVSRSIGYIHFKIRPGCSQHMYLDLRFMTQMLKKKKVSEAFLPFWKCGKTPISIGLFSIPWRAVGRLSCLCKILSTMRVSLGNEVSSSLKAESTWQQGAFEELSLTSISESRELYMNQQKFVFILRVWFSSHLSESVEKPLRSQWCINSTKMKNRAGGIL